MKTDNQTNSVLMQAIMKARELFDLIEQLPQTNETRNYIRAPMVQLLGNLGLALEKSR